MSKRYARQLHSADDLIAAVEQYGFLPFFRNEIHGFSVEELCPPELWFADDVPDRYFMARLNAAVECERLLRSSGSFDLTFFCPDPFGYAIEDETFSITEAGNSTVTRLIGNMESNPIYRIEGVVTSGAGNSISITTNGQELKIVNAALAAGETLVVDTDRMTAYVEDADGMILRNALPYLEELNFPTLAVGSNTVSVTAANATFTGLEIQARSRWR